MTHIILNLSHLAAWVDQKTPYDTGTEIALARQDARPFWHDVNVKIFLLRNHCYVGIPLHWKIFLCPNIQQPHEITRCPYAHSLSTEAATKLFFGIAYVPPFIPLPMPETAKSPSAERNSLTPTSTASTDSSSFSLFSKMPF